MPPFLEIREDLNTGIPAPVKNKTKIRQTLTNFSKANSINNGDANRNDNRRR